MQEPECIPYVRARVFLFRLDNDSAAQRAKLFNLICTRLPMRTNQEQPVLCRSLSILFSIKSITYKKYHLPLNFLVDRSETLCLIQSNETQNGTTNMTYLEALKTLEQSAKTLRKEDGNLSANQFVLLKLKMQQALAVIEQGW
jgi:hypothetical protein